ncbi:penicillin-binding protein 1C [Paracoccus aurantiacus]|uniref:peptidoglycan glycosyltransferase n=2 Tax=Paracoccus aurantiacus TaxID=2599412 RepID=A0A5C6SBB1_9RHOB|nr:penicillin-binding protein 1C [Paracoccus aurantiacus]TXB71302.1 penicillin-binding protein 1C [Paracoccus aurantiacus]
MARLAFGRWLDATPMPALAVPTGTEVLARDGSLLRAFQVGSGLWRLAPPAAGVDPRFQKMLIAWEDRNFDTHRGVDPRAVARAAAQAIWHGRIVSGASTLSMQTARLLERGPTADWRAKLRQARLAMAMERRIGKEGVLSLYLRLAPYGGNTEGVRAATLMWFGKEPTRLTPAEAALLVALPQAPEARRPDIPARREAARIARDRVIARAEQAGIINAEAAELARGTPLPTARRAFPAHAALLAERLRRQHPGAARIETTIDPTLQRAAERMVARAVAGRSERVSAAAILADHQSGEILAEVGTADFGATPRAGFIDMTRAIRSPGSTLKPFVYALGFDEGLIHPDTLIEDRPAIFGRWQPENFDRMFRGTVTIREALRQSLNVPVVRVADALGPARIMALLRRAGMRVETANHAPPGLAVVLGGAGVSLRDLVTGYAALARGGRTVVLTETPADAEGQDQTGMRLVSPAAAWQVAAILSRIPPPDGRAAGRIAYKTGTSYGHRDALSLGFDGRFVAGIWLGRPDGTPVPGAFGGQVAAPLLFDIFDTLGARRRPLPPPPPETLIASNPQLPAPLRRFTPPGHISAAANGPGAPARALIEPLVIVFPPDGAELELGGQSVPVRLRGGVPPYTWMLNGTPAVVALSEPVATLPGSPGASEVTVTDASGATRRARFRMVAP